MPVERASQLVGETLIFCFLFALITGGFLAYHFVPGDDVVIYDGSYTPLQGVQMSQAYESALRIGLDVDGGMLLRQLHHKSLYVLILGVVIWVLLARHRYAIISLGLCVVGGVTGYASVDDLLSKYIPGTTWIYVLHLLVALGMAAALVKASRLEAATQPRTVGLVFLAGCIAFVTIYWL